MRGGGIEDDTWTSNSRINCAVVPLGKKQPGGVGEDGAHQTASPALSNMVATSQAAAEYLKCD